MKRGKSGSLSELGSDDYAHALLSIRNLIPNSKVESSEQIEIL
jgi:hypothetical protein